MEKRTKVFLGVLAGALVVASVATNSPQILMMGIGATFMAWFFWRCYVFLALLLQPLRKAIKPQVDAVNQHVDQTLRRSGLDSVADAAKSMQAGLDGAVEATQKGIDQRREWRD